MAEPAARVEPGRRLVEEEQARLPDQRRREVEPPAHAARVGLRHAVGRVVEREPLEQLVGAPARLRARQLVEATEHPEVLAPREVLVDRGVLAREADQLADRLRVARDVEPADARAAGVRP